MTNFIRDNSKKLMAIFGVILMIAFIMPTTTGQFMGRGSKRLWGHVGESKVYDVDIHNAVQHWQILDKFIVISPERTRAGEIVTIGQTLRQVPVFKNLADQLEEHPELYYLLEHEADQMGVVVSPGRVDALFREAGWAVRLPDTGAVVSYEAIGDPAFKNAVRQSAAAFLKVQQSLERAIGVVKVSAPRRQHLVALATQQLVVSYAQFRADDFLARVPAPTPEQLRQHFDRYAGTLEDEPANATNPHGFGYKFPNRVTLQYIGVRRGDVEAAVRATKSTYDWDVDAHKAYRLNPSRYMTDPRRSPATTRSTTQPFDLSAPLGSAPASQPTTQPFHDVREQIIAELMAPDIARKMREVQDRINSRLQADFHTFQTDSTKSGPPATQPTFPATAPTTGYASFEYLQQLAADVQKQTGILPVIGAVNQLQDQERLQALEGIGGSFAQNGIPFPLYASQLSSSFVEPALREKVNALDPFEPSQVLQDISRSTWVFRFTSASPSAPPPSMDEVKEAVERDWKIARAYEMAKAQAEELLRAAESRPLTEAAASASVQAHTTPPFGMGTQKIENLDLPAESAYARFATESMSLLSIAATRPTLPTRLIEMPDHNRAIVVQLVSAEPKIGSPAIEDLEAEQQLRIESARSIMDRWFDYKSVVARTGWRSDRPAPAAEAAAR